MYSQNTRERYALQCVNRRFFLGVRPSLAQWEEHSSLPTEEPKLRLGELLRKLPGVIPYSVSFTKDIEDPRSRAAPFSLAS